MSIHSLASVSHKANIGENVKIGAFCVIGDNVTIGDNCELVSHVVVDGRVTMGYNNKVYPFTTIGLAPQDLKYAGEESEVIIGNNNTIREHVTIHAGTKTGLMRTVVGNDCLLMVGVHLAHDCVVGNNVILANNATLAGHVIIEDYAILGGLVAVHQNVRIGKHAMVGGMTGVENDVIPFGLVYGNRGTLKGINLVGLKRHGFTKDQITHIYQSYQQLFLQNVAISEELEKVRRQFGNDENIKHLAEFIMDKSAKRALCMPEK